MIDENLKIGDKIFNSRLMLGTGRYNNTKQALQSIENSMASIVTVAIRRTHYNKTNGKRTLVDLINWKKLWMLPNTAGCETAEEAIRIASLGLEVNKKIGQEDNNFIKLEVICDSEYLLPDPVGTLKAAEYLVNHGFTVLPYIYPDPTLAKQLEDIGCHSIMPLGSSIGSGQGLQNLYNINIIIENSNIPVIIDAGIGSPSEASKAMEIGASAVLMNTAIAKSKSPPLMAEAMKLATISGRKCYLAGRMKTLFGAKASSPVGGIIKLLK